MCFEDFYTIFFKDLWCSYFEEKKTLIFWQKNKKDYNGGENFSLSFMLMIKNRKSILGKIKYLLLLGVVFLSLVGYSNAQEIYDCSALVSASLDKSSLSIGETLTINYSVLDSWFTATDIFRYGTNHGIGWKSTSWSPDTNIYSHAFQNIDVSVLLKENSGPWSTHCFVWTITVSWVCGDGDVSWNEQCDDGGTENGDGCSTTCQREIPSCASVDLSFSPTAGVPGTTVTATLWWALPGWINITSLTWRSWQTNYSPNFPLLHTYPSVGTFTPSFRIENSDNSGSFRNCSGPQITISASCGNGVVESGEQCDDGNTSNWDGCSSSCQREVPSCSDANLSFTPTSGIPGTEVTATFSVPNWVSAYSLDRWDGSPLIQPPHSPLSHIYTNVWTYSPVFVLRNTQNPASNRICTRNNEISINADCWNGIVEWSEQCDDGNLNDWDGCSATCQWETPSCTNLSLDITPSGAFIPAEVIANFSANSGFELLGLNRWDGFSGSITTGQTTATHTYSTDGAYTIELIGKNTGSSLTGICQQGVLFSQSVCGDGIVEDQEQCDDGNLDSWDGCSATCQLEYPVCDALDFQITPKSGNIPLSVNFSFATITGFQNTLLKYGNQILNATGSESLSGFYEYTFDTAATHKIDLTVINALSGAFSQICSFDVEAIRKSGGSGWGGFSKDDCPKGDFSPSYYDGKCDPEPPKKSELELPMIKPKENYENVGCTVPANAPYSQSLIDAFLWAYKHKITTTCPIESANLDGPLLRRHMAKMISEFAMQILDMKPNYSKTCSFPDLWDQTQEMKDYIKLSCQLGLMGYDADGTTKRALFEPNREVSRAQFATLLSRLLWDNMFDNNDDTYYYVEHIKSLRAANIMDHDVSNPKRTEKRGEVLKMLKRSYEYFNNMY